jgi:hypothetical protein
MRLAAVVGLWVVVASGGDETEKKVLSPVEARKCVGQEITVQMPVKAAKNRLEKRGEIYLDSEGDFRDAKNFAVVITKAGAAKFQAAGIDDPAVHFKDRTIRATGTVRTVDEVPRIEIDDPKQMEIVKQKSEVRSQKSQLVECHFFAVTIHILF